MDQVGVLNLKGYKKSKNELDIDFTLTNKRIKNIMLNIIIKHYKIFINGIKNNIYNV